MQQHETLKIKSLEGAASGTAPSVHPKSSVDFSVDTAWMDRINASIEKKVPDEKKPSPETKPDFIGKIQTSIGDCIRDVITANKMAADAFEGDTALMQIAKGGMTTLVGVGLERVLEDSFHDAIAVGGKGRFLDRPFVTISEKTRRQLADMRLNDTKMYDFVYHAAKDLATGVIYNGLAFFSRPMFKSAGGEHMLASVALDAMEALGTTGLESHYAHEDATRAVDVLREKQSALRSVIAEKGKPAASSEGAYELANLRQQRDRLGDKIRRDVKKIPIDTSLAWQMTARKYLNYSNPATLLGLDMIAKGGAEFIKNWKDVQKIRKENGGLAGKSVNMPKEEGRKNYGDRKPWTNNREQGNRRPYTKGTVYYGQGQSQKDAKQQEEEDRAKLM